MDVAQAHALEHVGGVGTGVFAVGQLQRGNQAVRSRGSGGGRIVKAVENVSIEVRRGEIIALLQGERATLKKMYREGGGKVRLTFKMPSRGLIGLPAQTVTVEGHGRDALTSDTDFEGSLSLEGHGESLGNNPWSGAFEATLAKAALKHHLVGGCGEGFRR